MSTDPLEALKLFQQTEIGLCKEIADGAVHYEKRLKEAIEGQAQTRKLVEANEGVVVVD